MAAAVLIGLAFMLLGSSFESMAMPPGGEGGAHSAAVKEVKKGLPTAQVIVMANGAIANGVAQDVVKVLVTDGSGAIVVGQNVTFSVTVASGTGAPFSPVIPTDGTGYATLTVNSSTVISYNVVVSVTGYVVNGSPVMLYFVPGPVDLTKSKIVIDQNNSLANGTATDNVHALIVDALGNPIANQSVTFSIVSGTAGFTTAVTVTSDASGNTPTVSLASAVAGNVQVSAKVGGADLSNSPATVNFVAGPVSLAKSTIVIDQNHSPADGSTADILHAVLLDANGNPVANQSVTFNIVSGTANFTTAVTVTTDATGKTTGVQLVSTTVGNVQVSATYGGSALSNSPALVDFKAGPVDLTKSQIIIAQNHSTADGSTPDIVYAKLVDAFNNPVANATVTFGIVSGTGNFSSPMTVTTDAAGNTVPVSLVSTVAGSVQVSATYGGSALSNSPATVDFLAGAVSLTLSSIIVDQDHQTANGTATDILHAHLVDVRGNPVANQTVTFSIVSGIGNFVSTITVVTDASGNTPGVSLVSTVAGSVQVAARYIGSGLGNSPVSVDFVAGPVDMTKSKIIIDQNHSVADGNTPDKVHAYLVDANNNPVVGQTVTFGIVSGSGSFTTPVTVVTDVTGNTGTVSVVSTVAGTVQVSAKVGGTALGNSPASVDFVAGVVDPTKSRIIIDQNHSTANGVMTDIVHAFLADAQGNPVAGATATFSIVSGTGNFTSVVTVTSDATGNTPAVTLVSTVAGNVQVASLYGGSGLSNSPVTVDFVAGAVDLTKSKIIIDQNHSTADGNTPDIVHALLVDAQGNPVSGATVTFSIVSGNGNFTTPVTVTSNATGVTAGVSLVSTVAGNVQVAALYGGTGLSNSPVTVDFVSGVVDVTKSSIIIDQTHSPADGSTADIVHAHLVDAQGNPVAGASVTFGIVSGTGNFVTAVTVSSDAAGNTPQVKLVSTVAGNVQVSAKYNGSDLSNSPATVDFVAGTVDLTKSQIIIDQTHSVADGNTPDIVHALLVDAQNNPVPNATVTFGIVSGNGNFITAVTVTSDATGKTALVKLVSTVAGSVQVSAKYNGSNLGNSPATVDFVAGPVDLTKSQVIVTQNHSIADGNTPDIVYAHLVDAQGNPVAGATVTFSIVSGTAGFTTPFTVTSDASGNTNPVSLASTVVGNVQVAALYNGAGLSNSPVTVDFKGGAVSLPLSSIIVDQDHGLANGVATDIVHAHLVDAQGNPVAGQTVTFGIVSGTGNFITVATVVTDVSGNTPQVKLVSTVAGNVQVSAKYSGSDLGNSPVTVDFVAGAVDFSKSQIVIDQNHSAADGNTPDIVHAHLVDAYNNPVSGATVTFNIVSGTASFITPVTVVSDASGNTAGVSLVSTVSGNVQVAASFGGNALGNSPVTVDFKVGVVDVTKSTIVIDVNHSVADGNTADIVHAHLVDAQGNAVAGATVTFSIVSGTGNFISTVTVTSDATGNTPGVSLVSTVAGNVQVAAKYNGNGLSNSPVTVDFVAGALNLLKSQIIIDQNHSVADGNTPDIVHAHLVDAQGNPIAGGTVTFTIVSGSGSFITSVTVTSDATGNTSPVSLVSTVAGNVQIAASYGGNGLGNSPVTVDFVAGVVDVTKSTILIDKNHSTADGNTADIVHAHLVDAQGNPVPNASVTFSIVTGTGNFTTPVTVSSDAAGNTAGVSLVSTVVGNVQVAAKYNGSALSNSPVTVDFFVGSVDVTKSMIVIDQNHSVADGNTPDIVHAHLVDAQGNPVANQTVTFGIVTGVAGFTTPVTVVTDVNGNTPGVSLTSTVAGNVQVSAKFNGVDLSNSPATVDFKAGAVDLTKSTILIDKNHSPADGSTPDIVHALLVDAYNNPVPNATVTFSIVSGTANFTTTVTVTSDATGNTPGVSLTSNVIGNVLVAGQYNGAVLSNSPVTVDFKVGAVSLPLSSIIVDQDHSVADGITPDVVHAHLVDANGNPVAGATVTFSIVSGTANFITTVTVVTDALGNTPGVSLVSYTAGKVQVSAKYTGSDLGNSPVTVDFVAGAVNVAKSQIVIDQNHSAADGNTPDIVHAHLVDAYNNPVANQTVTFSIVSGTAGFTTTATVTTDANGNTGAVSLTSTVIGNVQVAAQYGGNGLGNSPVTVDFVAGAVDLALSQIIIDQNHSTADGNTADIVHAHLVDAQGHPVPNANITFSLAGGAASFTTTVTVLSDASGNTAQVSLVSTVAGNVQVAAKYNGNGLGNSPVTVDFVAGAVDPSKSQIIIDQNHSTADGNTPDKVHALLVDAYNNPVANATVTFAMVSGTAGFTSGLTVTSDLTGNTGIVSLTSTVAGNVQLSAAYGGLALGNSPATVDFVAGAVDITKSKIVIDQNHSPADGSTADIVHAVLVDANNNPVPNASISFSILSGTGTISGTATVTSNAAGITTGVSIVSNTAGNVQVAGLYNGNGLSNSPVTVDFKAGTVDITKSTIVVDQNHSPADGVTPDIVHAHLVDAQGNPVANASVTFSIVSGTASITSAVIVTTDAFGNTPSVTLVSNVKGSVLLSAKYNGNDLSNSPATVDFGMGAPSATGGKTLLSVITNNAVSDGVATDSLSAYITDASGNPITNQSVTVTYAMQAGGSATGTAQFMQSVNVKTDANGYAGIGVSNTMPGNVFISATILVGSTPTAITGSPAEINFTGVPDVSNPLTQLIVISYEALADGTMATIVKAHLVDQYGNPVYGQAVDFKIDSGTATITTPGPWTTDQNGDVSVSLTSKTPGFVLVTATMGGKAIIFGSPARVKFAAINIYVPKVFTPNGDGTNDVLKPILVGMSEFHYFNVYNRWGNLIFTTQDANQGWDGRFKGVPQPVETYLWMAEGINTQGQKVVQKGMVSLVR